MKFDKNYFKSLLLKVPNSNSYNNFLKKHIYDDMTILNYFINLIFILNLAHIFAGL